MGCLEGRVAIITGAARGQGAAAARLFVSEGARVVIGDVLDDVGKDLAESLGDAATYRHLDVSSEDDWRAVVDEAVETLGGVDVLVNNAGILRFAALPDMPLEEYLRIVNINQVGTFLGMRAVSKPMIAAGRGSIVNISSVEGLAGMPYLTAYTATKFAIRGMTKVAALELGPNGIRVNSVHPGMIETDMVKDAAGGHEIDLSPAAKRIPIRRMGQSEEIAEVVLFLASDRSSYVTGAEIAADGGVTATHAFYLV
ncbi:MAG: 3alpha(or 20beta)-hydroxysteroid dehydrogenase [Pseudonocardiales bacterium]|jgi:3alpha(or 20beta)-hydroxysteroid dehydrogenase|nr:3alpha(or 20beta)-hydroxysteroid dehydrogenase [Pseudonocardiales bacterium]